MSIEVKNLDVIQGKLQKLSNTLSKSEMKNTNQAIGHIIKNDIEDAFAQESSPFGQKWKPLSSNTVMSYFGGEKKAFTKNRKRQRKGFLRKYGMHGSKKILRQSGNLADYWRVSANSSSVTIYNNKTLTKKGFAYGLMHQFGSKAPAGAKGHIPARPFLPIDNNGNLAPKTNKAINKFLDKKIEDAIK